MDVTTGALEGPSVYVTIGCVLEIIGYAIDARVRLRVELDDDPLADVGDPAVEFGRQPLIEPGIGVENRGADDLVAAVKRAVEHHAALSVDGESRGAEQHPGAPVFAGVELSAEERPDLQRRSEGARRHNHRAQEGGVGAAIGGRLHQSEAGERNRKAAAQPPRPAAGVSDAQGTDAT